MNTDRQTLTIENDTYFVDDLSEDILNNLLAIQQGDNAIKMLASLIRLTQIGSDQLARQTKKMLPAPIAEGLHDSIETTDEVSLETH